jgi:hypothetical protein
LRTPFFQNLYRSGIPAASRCDPLCNSSSRVLGRRDPLYGENVASPMFIAKGHGLLLITPRTSLPFISPGYVDRFVSKHSRDPQRQEDLMATASTHDVSLMSNRGLPPAMQSISHHPSVLLFNWQRAVPLAFTSSCTAPSSTLLINNPTCGSAGTLTAKIVSR